MNAQNELFVRHWFDLVSGNLSFASSEVSLFIACQFALESAYGTSLLVRSNNNICGMKLPHSRPTLAQCEKNGHAQFVSPLHCFFDYVIWLGYARISQNDLQDIDKFKSRLASLSYCPSKNYIASIEAVYQQYCFIINS